MKPKFVATLVGIEFVFRVGIVAEVLWESSGNTVVKSFVGILWVSGTNELVGTLDAMLEMDAVLGIEVTTDAVM